MSVKSTDLRSVFTISASILHSVALAATLVASSTESANASGKINYGSRAGMQVSVVSMEGLDSANAVIHTKHTKDDATAFCSEYVGNVSDDCIKTELETRLNDQVSADCVQRSFTNFLGDRFKVVGVNREKEPMARFRLQNLRTGEVADGSEASGYPTNIAIFEALCPTVSARLTFSADGEVAANKPALPQAVSLQGLEGKWYADNQKVCKGNPGETEGLLTFRRGHFIGLENDCTIRDSKVRGRSILVKMICEGEGMRELSSEILEVLNERQVMRTVWNQGKRYSFEITRCP